MTPVQIYSSAVFALVLVGVSFRRRPKIHIPIMLSAFALDLGSVVFLQIQRRAVQKAASKPTPILLVHISFALASLILYAAMTATGTRLARTGQGRGTHRVLAAIFLVCRAGTWVTSFFVV